MKQKKILPPTFFNAAIAIIILVYFVFPVSKIIHFPWNLPGIFLVIFGVVLNLHADSSFKKNSTTVKPFEKSSRLITTGTFRLSRNPMYLGMVSILLGICIILGSITPFFVVLIFIIVIDYLFIRVEESMLEEQFGNTWLKYKKSVRRWI